MSVKVCRLCGSNGPFWGRRSVCRKCRPPKDCERMAAMPCMDWLSCYSQDMAREYQASKRLPDSATQEARMSRGFRTASFLPDNIRLDSANGTRQGSHGVNRA